ncbi:deazaflavin-dependent oxidoreductase, nitroreductase family [Actinacidiphila rubida]|uniref:Deazaflavin-dependent oxidoreductase, nitroreductase family n=1 Tax=Actinacidiphila rubida TaxID=310780 RepID=A0A1H8Q5C4_9ACTN|nr:nitroreductase family deazaflavin-dependent oxidoreductase [Actinacidiphila rubida]SEO49114.1 deazaflavin-dependent oxidoreductase, nitroreductase family [Actinacidiphila rubida]
MLDAVRRFCEVGWVTRVAPKVVPPVDLLAHRLTGGRWVPTRLFMQTVVVTSTGRRTGLPRRNPLVAHRDADGSFLVIASNFGQAHDPAWAANLTATPDATVEWRGRTVPVRARRLSAEEKAAARPAVLRVLPMYDAYARRAAPRDIPVFRLTPVGGSAAGGGEGQAR